MGAGGVDIGGGLGWGAGAGGVNGGTHRWRPAWGERGVLWHRWWTCGWQRRAWRDWWRGACSRPGRHQLLPSAGVKAGAKAAILETGLRVSRPPPFRETRSRSPAMPSLARPSEWALQATCICTSFGASDQTRAPWMSPVLASTVMVILEPGMLPATTALTYSSLRSGTSVRSALSLSLSQFLS